MRLLLVYPPVFRTVGIRMTPLPLGMLQVAAYRRRQGDEVRCLNLEIGAEAEGFETRSIRAIREAYARAAASPERTWAFDAPWRAEFRRAVRTFDPDCVGFSLATEQVTALARLQGDLVAMEYPGAVVVGGPGMPLRLENRDWGEAARDARPALDLLEGQNPAASFGAVLASLGCPYNCAFCEAPGRWGRRVRRVPAGELAARCEAARAMGATAIHLMDDAAVLSLADADRLARVMGAVGLPWRTQVRGDVIAREPAVARTLADAGCVQVTMGLESGSPRILEAMGKGETVEEILAGADYVRGRGMRLTVNVIYGFPGETDDDLARTAGAIERLQPARVLAGGCVPYPGTRMADERKGFALQARKWREWRWSPFDPGFLVEGERRVEGPTAEAIERFIGGVEAINEQVGTAGPSVV